MEEGVVRTGVDEVPSRMIPKFVVIDSSAIPAYVRKSSPSSKTGYGEAVGE